MLSAGKYSESFLVTSGSAPRALFLTGTHRWHCFSAAEGSAHRGLIVDAVSIQPELSSAVSLDEHQAVDGMLILAGDQAAVRAITRVEFTQRIRLPLTGERFSQTGNEIGFYRWRVVVGEADERMILHEIDVTPSAS